MGYLVRDGQHCDLTNLEDMIDAFRKEQEITLNRRVPEFLSVHLFGENARLQVQVAAEAHSLVGYTLSQTVLDPNNELFGLYLCQLFVRPGYRRLGIGIALWKALEESAAKQQLRFIWFVSSHRNVGANAFYRSVKTASAPVLSHFKTLDAALTPSKRQRRL